MKKKKISALATLEVLRKYTDNEHRLNTGAIGKILEEEYGIVNERRTIYSDIDILREFGYDIPEYDHSKVGFFLNNRLFSQEEVGIIEKSLAECNSISKKAKKNCRK